MTGLIYGYFKNNKLVYVGRTVGPFTVDSVLNARHKKHLKGKEGKFDPILRSCPNEFTLKVLHVKILSTALKTRNYLKLIESYFIKALQPIYNVLER